MGISKPDGKLHIAFINIGQGDCTLIKCPNGKVVMIDCGSTKLGDAASVHTVQGDIRTCLDGDLNEIDVLILTHSDEDHYNQLGDVLGNTPIKKLYHSDILGNFKDAQRKFNKWYWGYKPYKGRAANIGEWIFAILNEDDSPKGNKPELILDGSTDDVDCQIYILAAHVEPSDEDALKAYITNSLSIVVQIVYRDRSGEKRIMITGDATEATEKFIVERYGPDNLKADILRVPHHGSNSSSSDNFVNATNPNIAIVSCVRNNTAHHLPKKSVITKYKAKVNGGLTSRHEIGYFDDSKLTFEIENINHHLFETGINGTRIYTFPEK